MALNPENWWGDFTFSLGDALRWTVGPLTLVVQRLRSEWRVAWTRTDIESDADEWSIESETASLDDWPNIERHAFSGTSESLLVLPRLADRSVVTRPVAPFTIPAGEYATLFVSTPLWMRISVDQPENGLLDLPIVRPSDTWFGTNTQEGELCYASQTQARMYLDQLTLRTHRAVTALTIQNQTGNSLRLERLNLSVPYLSLFADRNGMLWTQDVTVNWGDHKEPVTLRLSEGIPSHATGPVMVNGPRKQLDTPVLLRALSALFG